MKVVLIPSIVLLFTLSQTIIFQNLHKHQQGVDNPCTVCISLSTNNRADKTDYKTGTQIFLLASEEKNTIKEIKQSLKDFDTKSNKNPRDPPVA